MFRILKFLFSEPSANYNRFSAISRLLTIRERIGTTALLMVFIPGLLVMLFESEKAGPLPWYGLVMVGWLFITAIALVAMMIKAFYFLSKLSLLFFPLYVWIILTKFSGLGGLIEVDPFSWMFMMGVTIIWPMVMVADTVIFSLHRSIIHQVKKGDVWESRS